MDDLRQMREDFKDHQAEDVLFHASIIEKLDKMDKRLDPIVDAYKAVILSKSFVIGFGSIIVAIGAIGAGFVWLINQAVNK